MAIELTLITLALLIIGVATFAQQFAYLTKKQIWRACEVNSVAITKWQNLMPFYQFKDKQLLVEYNVDGTVHSCIIPFSKRFYRKAKQGKQLHIFVDPKRPDIVAQKVGKLQLLLALLAIVFSTITLIVFN